MGGIRVKFIFLQVSRLSRLTSNTHRVHEVFMGSSFAFRLFHCRLSHFSVSQTIPLIFFLIRYRPTDRVAHVPEQGEQGPPESVE